MKSYFEWVSEQARNDDGESTVISTVFVFPILLMMIITMIEIPIFYSNRNLLQNDLRQGARTAAILGGTSTKLSDVYGNSTADACAAGSSDEMISEYKDRQVSTDGNISSLVNARITVSGKNVNLITGSKSMVTCATAYSIFTNNGYIAFHVYNIHCGPQSTKYIGESTFCRADYYYDGIPGGSMSLIGGTNHFGWGKGVNQAGADVGSDVNLTGNTGNIADSSSSSDTTLSDNTANEPTGFNSGTMQMSAQSEVCMGNVCNSES